MIQLRGTRLLQAAQAILSVLPLDSFVEHPLERMHPGGDPATVAEIQARFLRMASQSTGLELAYGRWSDTTFTGGYGIRSSWCRHRRSALCVLHAPERRRLKKPPEPSNFVGDNMIRTGADGCRPLTDKASRAVVKKTLSRASRGRPSRPRTGPASGRDSQSKSLPEGTNALKDQSPFCSRRRLLRSL